MIGFIIFITMIIIGYFLTQKYELYDRVPKNTYKRKFIELTRFSRDKDNINIEIKNDQISNYKDAKTEEETKVNYDEWTPLSLP
jgi:hypothetical protein